MSEASWFGNVQDVTFISLVQSLNCVWLLATQCDCSTPGLLVYHHLPQFTQTPVHQVGDTIQPSHPLSSLSPPAFNLSQHQGLFKWVSYSHQVAKVLGFQLQNQSFQWIFRTDFLLDWLVGSPCSPRDSQEFSPAPQFKSINSLTLSFLHSPTLTSIHLWPQGVPSCYRWILHSVDNRDITKWASVCLLI